MSNLFANAIQSQRANPWIKIEAFEGIDHIKIVVTDKGSGMSPDMIKKALHGGFTTKQDGKGIGLSSSAETLKSLGGDISIYSTPKKGTSIILTLPRGDIPFWYHTGSSQENIFKIPTSTSLNHFIRTEKYIKGYVYAGKYHYEREFFEFLEKNDVSIMRINDIENNQDNDFDVELVLIDDDKYVCKAWELNMRDNGRKIKTFLDYDDFLSKQKRYPRHVKLYLDRHVGNSDLFLEIDSFINMGFKDITYISSDIPPEHNSNYKVQFNKLPPL
jgi:hypothetical protein